MEQGLALNVAVDTEARVDAVEVGITVSRMAAEFVGAYWR